MDGAEYTQTGQEFEEILIKLRDLEEKQRLTKDRLLLISQNLLEIKEKNMQEILGIKKDLQKMNRLMNFIETASSEFSKFAKKEDLEILSKQAKMFQPLKLEKSTKQ